MFLILIRHGHGPHVGKRLPVPDSPLSKVGLEQAEDLVARFDGTRIDKIVSSPMIRARKTAAPLAKARGLKVTTRAGLGDVAYGKLGGKTLKNLMKGDLPRDLALWPSGIRFPDGETLLETQQRVVGEIEKLRQENKGKIVAVFSHGDPIRLTLAHYMGAHIDLFRRISVDPVSVSALDLRGAMPSLRTTNHLEALSDIAPKIAIAPKEDT